VTDGPLVGLGVLVTRPEPDDGPLARKLADAGAIVWQLPAVRIEAATPDEDLLGRARASLDTGLFIFVSRNAVRFGLPALGGPPARALAVGPSTARELSAAGISVLSESAGFDSETLLRLDLLTEPLDEEIWIVRGEGGRALLGETLAARGAKVAYLEVYRRRPPKPEPKVLADTLAAWRHGGVGAVTATSVEILDNLRNLLGSEYADLLSEAPLVTASERVVQRAAETGHRAERIVADSPGDEGLVSALAAWHGAGRKRTGNAAMNENKHGPEEPGQDEAAAVGDAAAAEAEAAAETTQASADPPASGGGKGLAATALVVALAGAGASGFHWWQGQSLGDAAVSEAARLEGNVKRVDAGLTTLENRLTNLEGTADSAGRRLDSLRGSLQEDFARLSARDRALEARLAAVASRDPAADEPAIGPLLAETEYLLRVAARSVSLAGRPGVAAAALEAADKNLAELDDPRLQTVREQIADDRTALAGAARPDTAGVAMRLGSLASKVESLPLDPDLAPEGTDFGRPVKQPDAASGWDRLVGKVRAFFSDLFRVRAVEGDIRPVLAEDEAFFLYRNLELDLKTARLAALSEDTAGYREAIRAARTNLERYFDTSDPAVEGALKTLGELEGVGIETEMPDVSGSLAAFQSLDLDDAAHSIGSGSSGPEPRNAPPAPEKAMDSGDEPVGEVPGNDADRASEDTPAEAAGAGQDGGGPAEDADTGEQPPGADNDAADLDENRPPDDDPGAQPDESAAAADGGDADAGDAEDSDADGETGPAENGNQAPAGEADPAGDDDLEEEARAARVTVESGRT
jgi:uncharacterized protein HemX/uroporphyrinogen-III synthase